MIYKERKGIILAGGMGSRLAPLTNVLSKHLLPVFDKPMVYYPLSTLMLAGIRAILIITKPEDLALFQLMFSFSHQWGLNIEFMVQEKPDGIASALILAEPFLDGAPSVLILGDNIFYSSGLTGVMRKAMSLSVGASIFTNEMASVNQYAVVELDKNGFPLTIEEKPENPRSNLVVTGLYFYDGTASERAKQLKPSKRGELEITDLNQSYLDDQCLSVCLMHRGAIWFDAGNHENLLEASSLIASIQHRLGVLISSPEEIAFRNGWIELGQLENLISALGESSYRTMLSCILNQERKG